MRNILLTIEYDGTGFSGWQRQPDSRTVQGEIEAALSKIIGSEVTIDGTSRTDSGVHAFEQHATVCLGEGIPTERIAKALNDALSSPGKDGDVRIIEAREMPEDFHARYSAIGKTYRYMIFNGVEMPVFLSNYRYHVRRRLDIDAMRKAALAIEGEHDFAAFQAQGSTPQESTVRDIDSIVIYSSGEEIAIEVTGDGFLYNMVRIIAGTLVDVGLGKIPEGTVGDIVESCDRQKAGHTAPPQGLYLAKIYY